MITASIHELKQLKEGDFISVRWDGTSEWVTVTFLGLENSNESKDHWNLKYRLRSAPYSVFMTHTKANLMYKEGFATVKINPSTVLLRKIRRGVDKT